MSRRYFWIGPLAAGLAAVATLYPQASRNREIAMPEAVSFRVLFGLTDSEPTRWDGSVTLSAGTIAAIRGWRFAGNDSTDYRSSWKLSTRTAVVRANQKKKGGAGAMADNGVTITAAVPNPDARFDIETPQGKFSFSARELPYGETKFVLDGRARVEQVPPVVQLTTSADEQDHPALAQSGDDVYLAYVDFSHGNRADLLWGRTYSSEPSSFDSLARPAAGDQVKLMRYSKSRRAWSAPENVSAAGQDCMRAAVAVDGSGRVWVVWSTQRDGNFDLYAKSARGGTWSGEMRLTSNAGQDLNPVAATDSTGRVWIAWQAYRNGSLDILAAAQDGERFGSEQRVSPSPMNDWDPAIAAGPDGEIAVAWDTYEKGDYDVVLRRMRFRDGVRMDAPQQVAASANFEARPSIAYDPQGRVWIAYEGSDTKWGKDFGAYETTGIGLYQGHNLRVAVSHAGSLSTTADDIAESLPGGRVEARRRRASQQKRVGLSQPNPELARIRPASGTPQPPALPKNSFPRIAVSPNGIVSVTYRLGTLQRSAAGPLWNGQLVYFDGEQWRGPVDIPGTDGLLDVRAALLPSAPDRLLVVSTTDHRQAAVPGGARRASESVNSDLYAAELVLPMSAKPAKLVSRDAGAAPPSADVAAERKQIALMRDYRASAGGSRLQLVRGEFHRHTELSADGGMADGPIIDAYRYMLDAAAMDWGGCCDHDNGTTEYYWWIAQKLTDAYNLDGKYTAMFSYERSVRYPEGHRNTVMAQRGVRPLPRLPKVADEAPPAPAPDTQMLYKYLRRFDGIVASHTSGTNMGTDWRDNDPIVEPVVEIYQGDRQNYEMPSAPRSNDADDSIGGWRPLGFVSLALAKGYKLGFQASSDHVSTHMSYCNLWVTDTSRKAVLEAFKKRRVYGATDNILADVRSGSHFMGEEFTASEPPSISVKLWGTADFAKVHVIKDGQSVYSTEPKSPKADFTWRDSAAQRGKTSYYYVRGEQADGELVWVSPMWITYK